MIVRFSIKSGNEIMVELPISSFNYLERLNNFSTLSGTILGFKQAEKIDQYSNLEIVLEYLIDGAFTEIGRTNIETITPNENLDTPTISIYGTASAIIYEQSGEIPKITGCQNVAPNTQDGKYMFYVAKYLPIRPGFLAIFRDNQYTIGQIQHSNDMFYYTEA